MPNHNNNDDGHSDKINVDVDEIDEDHALTTKTAMLATSLTVMVLIMSTRTMTTMLITKMSTTIATWME